MPLGKTIRLYLIDGSATGPIAAEIINWTGQVVLVPRSELHELAGREQLRGTGIYILVGPSEHGDADSVYLGEADSVYWRLKEHDREKDFWTRAVAITSKDMNLTKAHGRYLESRLIQMARTAARVTLENGTTPPEKNLPESDVADMEYFLEQLQLELPVLGLDFLRPVATRSRPIAEDDAPLFVLESVGVKATAREVDGRFVVLAGSSWRVEATASFDTYVKLREQIIASGKLEPADAGFLRFTEDVEFNSPSAAASVLIGSNINGRDAWVTKTGETYGTFKQRQIEAAEGAAREG